MGAGVSKDGRILLEAARKGDAAAVCTAIKQAGPELVKARTLLQARGVLHIAAREGQAQGACVCGGSTPSRVGDLQQQC